ncbi:sodium/proline symporter [Microbulbifer sp. SSSA002]|uniref:sodium/proline symporter n=1 Tax=Microbulbifer sp. SSSA002 TaxID=3243376 RepID=UPI00403932C8
MVYSFIGFLLLFTLVGISSALFSRATKADYYLASSGVSPWLVGLSAVATNNSGYMFIGVIGYTYLTGLASVWLMVGWIAGDFLASLYVHKRLRCATSASGEVSYAGALSNWYGQKHSTLQRLIGTISLLFLLIYASAQLVAGSKALHVLLDWPLWSGAVVGALLVCLYCLAGGIRASIWTDAAQSIVMISAMGTLLAIALANLGGIPSAIAQMQAIEGFTDWLPKGLAFSGWSGVAVFVISWGFAGLSVIGQPHVMIRFMTLSDSSKMHRARGWYYLWFILFYCMATGVGLLSKVFIADSGNFDAELALPTMAIELLPPTLVGLILAGIFAATMSTADSLLLSCSAAITHDILPRKIEKTWLLKLVTVAITGAALLLALANNQSVFSLVIFAWSSLASAFAPLLLVLCFGGRPTQATAITAVIVGFTTAITWRALELHGMIYEGLPGIALGLIVFYLASFARRPLTPPGMNNQTN